MGRDIAHLILAVIYLGTAALMVVSFRWVARDCKGWFIRQARREVARQARRRGVSAAEQMRMAAEYRPVTRWSR